MEAIKAPDWLVFGVEDGEAIALDDDSIPAHVVRSPWVVEAKEEGAVAGCCPVGMSEGAVADEGTEVV